MSTRVGLFLACCLLTAGVAFAPPVPATVPAVTGASGPGPSATGPAAVQADDQTIARLIAQLGDNNWKLREEASRKLSDIGPPAFPALRQATANPDLEVSLRAQMVIREIVGPHSPEKLQHLRRDMQAAMYEANYQEMVRLGEKLTLFTEGIGALDWMWLGHGCQLDGKWKEAVAAYQRMLPLMQPDQPPPPGPMPAGVGPVGKAVAVGNVSELNSSIRFQRVAVMRWIARMQLKELNDPKSAAATLAQADESFDPSDAQHEYLHRPVLRELASARHSAGDLEGALATWTRLHVALEGGKQDYWRPQDIEEAGQAVSKLPPDKILPETPFLLVLTPRQASVTLKPDEDATRQRSYRPAPNPDQPSSHYALCPPPGQEFATLEVVCDIDQHQPRYGGHFRCFTVSGKPHPTILNQSLGPTAQQTGRDTYKAKVDVPPGSGLVHVQTGSWKPYFDVHSVEIKATFRPVSKAAPPAPATRAWMQNEVLPKGGHLTLDGKPLTPYTANDALPAGKHRLRYEVPGRKDVFEGALLVEGGRQYGVFINLDSPFRWTQAGPGGMNSITGGCASLSRLADGSYLAIWSTWAAEGSRIMCCRSKDLSDWGKPEPLACNSIFDNISPAALVDRDGLLWLAYFSNRLCLQDTSTGAYRLFVTSTRDGRQWSSPRPVAIAGVVDGWPIPPVALAQAPDGQCIMLWKKWAGMDKSLAKVSQLEPISLAGDKALNLWNQHLTVDEKGLHHMVFDDFNNGIYHTTSPDGRQWSQPTLLVDVSPRRDTGRPQLLSAKEKVLLLYEGPAGAYLASISPGGPPLKPGEGVKLTNHVVPLGGSRATMTGDDQVLLLAGADTCWLLTARLAHLLAVPAGASATRPAGGP